MPDPAGANNAAHATTFLPADPRAKDDSTSAQQARLAAISDLDDDPAASESASLLSVAQRADSVYSPDAGQQTVENEEQEAAVADTLWRDVRRVCVLAAPIIVSNVTVPLTAAVDVAIVGRLGHASYLGAVALGGLLFNYIYWGLGFVKMGTTGLTANAFGTLC